MSRMSIRASIGGESGVRLYPNSFKQGLSQIAHESLESLTSVWREAGYEDSECQQLLGDLLVKVKSLFANEILAEKQILDHAKAQVLLRLNLFNDLRYKLGREPQSEEFLGVTCTEKLMSLDKLIEDIESEVSSRQEVFLQEISKINEITNDLGEPVVNIDDFPVPSGSTELSDARLESIYQYYKQILQMRDQRIQAMKEMAEACFQHMEDLEIPGEGWESLENSCSGEFLRVNDALTTYFVSNKQKWTLGLHRNDLILLQKRCNTLNEEKNQRRDELAHIGGEIARLWTLLRIPTADRERFQSSIKMNLSKETIVKGRQELERLMTVRTTSLKKVLAAIRGDILQLWQESGMDDEATQHQEFPLFFLDIDKLEDSSVEEHENYFMKLKQRTETLRPILAKIYKREQIVQERIELENIQLNPERLIARGPNAREERKREEGMTIRVKNLDKLTKEILGHIQSWEELHGPLIFGGERYSDRIQAQEEKYIEIRDSLRNSRKKKESISLKPEPLLGKPSLSGKRPTLSNAATATLMSKSAGSQFGLLTTSNIASFQAGMAQDENSSNKDRNSTGSDDTNFTEVRDRGSCATLIRPSMDPSHF